MLKGWDVTKLPHCQLGQGYLQVCFFAFVDFIHPLTESFGFARLSLSIHTINHLPMAVV
jgi:hypothetical protein